MGVFDIFKSKKKEKGSKVLKKESIILSAQSKNKTEAIEMGGQLLVDGGYVTEEYVAAMKEREKKVSTYMGNGVAIPHGTNEAKENIRKSGISVLQIPEGVDFGDGNRAYLIISIAGKGDEHLNILKNLATICEDDEEIERMVKTDNKDLIYDNLLLEEE
ncbi:PTS sugar transporter subunit IIA [Halanaerocella petrolearia]